MHATAARAFTRDPTIVCRILSREPLANIRINIISPEIRHLDSLLYICAADSMGLSLSVFTQLQKTILNISIIFLTEALSLDTYSTFALVLPISIETIVMSGVVQRVDNSTGALRRDQMNRL